MKIRVMPLYIPFIKALGGTPITIPPPEIYTAMERGVVEGVYVAKGWDNKLGASRGYEVHGPSWSLSDGTCYSGQFRSLE